MIKATIRSAFRFWQFCSSGFLLKIQLELSTLVENFMRPKSFCVYNFRTQSKKNVLNCSFIAETDFCKWALQANSKKEKNSRFAYDIFTWKHQEDIIVQCTHDDKILLLYNVFYVS